MLPAIRSRFATPSLFESSLEPWSDLRREIDRLFDSVVGSPTSSNFRRAHHDVRDLLTFREKTLNHVQLAAGLSFSY